MCQRDESGSVPLPGWKVLMFQLFTILSYANSAINPFLYAFTSSQFRQHFSSVLYCYRTRAACSTVVNLRRLPSHCLLAVAEHGGRTAALPTVRPISVSSSSCREAARMQTGNGGRRTLAKVAMSVVVEMHDIPDVVRSIRRGTCSTDEVLSTQL